MLIGPMLLAAAGVAAILFLAGAELRRRALLLTTDDACEQLCDEAATDVCIRSYVPYSLVFPHAAAVAHHGGIGTTGFALGAGKPQIIVPFFAEHPDTAGRVSRLGVDWRQCSMIRNMLCEQSRQPKLWVKKRSFRGREIDPRLPAG
jgi:UDP:flavonoid glycosyltransferase YjiC (YdhE family)